MKRMTLKKQNEVMRLVLNKLYQLNQLDGHRFYFDFDGFFYRLSYINMTPRKIQGLERMIVTSRVIMRGTLSDYEKYMGNGVLDEHVEMLIRKSKTTARKGRRE